MSLSKNIKMKNIKVTLGFNVYNVFDIRNVNDIYPLTGEPDDPGTYYRNPEIENLPREGGEYSRSYYDRPWYYSSPRETNFFIRFGYIETSFKLTGRVSPTPSKSEPNPTWLIPTSWTTLSIWSITSFRVGTILS